ncbi:tRNA (adenosine(37)-N6)-threonylcarbamoyltransferase complex dimerization subunit type 1 TsaB [Aquimarina sp. ERC-38]|uniref:tRNA (adenosine(37)-N6)-threonylcarbamoyltransferase complex dimerization subunit type 1 TsaB n=1 Tax=Aquimarina sp. ERC-38 TaxID=2949996 RepID=UPI002245D8DD|nr:tRNA (adenosine(37)-N6)-threonylcarbamoyltransferase complex dimerization subunit type 1 TsaB [Aquimarina sp. ERC-38]UZO81190.1 tRNA (adenosine(37)-N6)-threonylcarbamoyltransferase complex dimerization subunit type 1 TsaB [Aquimarina sp. ERC-38]
MAFILNLETSSTNCSVALAKDAEVIQSLEDNEPGYSHAEKLHLFIDEVVRQASIKINQLDAIAVGEGPGSYTGLRIGVATAKGLCYALSKPLIAINSLEALASQVFEEDCFLIPMMDARRMEVYDSVFFNRKLVQETKATIVDATIYRNLIKESDKVRFIGNGVAKSRTFLNFPKASFYEDKMPSASSMASLSFQKYQNQNFEDIAYFDPFYLKEFKVN